MSKGSSERPGAGLTLRSLFTVVWRTIRRLLWFGAGFAIGALVSLVILASEGGAPFRFIYEAF